MIALALSAAAALTCGAVPRPGVAARDDNGAWRGTAVTACRRAADRLGRSGIRFRGYETRAAVLTARRDDIAFLSEAERRFADPAGVVIRPAAARSIQLLVAARQSPSAAPPVYCFIIGSAAEDALNRWIDAGHRTAIRLGFQEPDEMADGLASGKCVAMAIDAADRAPDDRIVTTLADLAIDAVTAAGRRSMMAAALDERSAIDSPRRPT